MLFLNLNCLDKMTLFIKIYRDHVIYVIGRHSSGEIFLGRQYAKPH